MGYVLVPQSAEPDEPVHRLRLRLLLRNLGLLEDRESSAS